MNINIWGLLVYCKRLLSVFILAILPSLGRAARGGDSSSGGSGNSGGDEDLLPIYKPLTH